MTSPISVDPEVYYSSAKQLLAEYGNLYNAVHQILVPQLSNTYGMGGNDHVAGRWNSEYRRVADHMILTLVSYGNALLTLSDMLNLAGYNWAVANYDADRNPNKGAQPAMPPPRVGQKWAPSDIQIPDAQPAPYTTEGRGLISQPENLAIQLLATLRKNNSQISEGDTDALAAAATVWRMFAEHDACAAGRARLDNLIGTFGSVRTPEAADVVANLTIIRDGVSAIEASAAGFSTATGQFGSSLSEFRYAFSGAISGSFPEYTPSTSVTNISVGISCTEEPAAESIETAGAILAAAVSGHYLYTVTAEAKIPDTDNLPSIQTKLEEIASSPIDELANRATWKSGPVRCALKPEGEQDFQGANDRVRSWIRDSVEFGNQVGIDPRLLLTVIYNEGAKRSDSFIEDQGSIVWDVVRENASPLREIYHDGTGMSLGLANMKEHTFNKLKEDYPGEFGNYRWSDMINQDSLAIKAAAFTLGRLKSEWAGSADDSIVEQYSLNEYIAVSYNAEDFLADYNDLGKIGPEGQKYINMTNENWKIASDLIDGAYDCR